MSFGANTSGEKGGNGLNISEMMICIEVFIIDTSYMLRLLPDGLKCILKNS